MKVRHTKGDAIGLHALHTTDFKTFTDASARLAMPTLSKHGGFLSLTRAEYTRLLAVAPIHSP